MLRTTTPDRIPVIAPQDNAEVFMLHFVSQQVGDEALKAKAYRYIGLALDQPEQSEALQFIGDEATLLLDGLGQIVSSMPETEWRHAQAKLMLEPPAANGHRLPARPHLTVVPGAING